MSDQSFERRIGTWLRELPGLWSHHPSDELRARQWRPGDFIWGHASAWGVIECKEVQGSRFPLSRWSVVQRNHAGAVTAAGGRYLLLVNFAPLRQVSAYPPSALLQRRQGSLLPDRIVAGHLSLAHLLDLDMEPVLTEEASRFATRAPG